MNRLSKTDIENGYGSIDWSMMAKLGLIKKINNEILHPMGLAISYHRTTGFSEKIILSMDQVFEYSEKTEMVPDEEIERKVKSLFDSLEAQP